MKPRSRHNSTKKNALRFIFFYRDTTALHPVPLTPLLTVTQHHENTEIHPSPMRDVVIEQKQLSSSTNTQPFYQTGQTSQVP